MGDFKPGTNIYDFLIACVCIIPITVVMFTTATNLRDLSEVTTLGVGGGGSAIAYGLLKKYILR